MRICSPGAPMTRAELEKTIQWLRNYVFIMEDRPDGERLKEQMDHLRKTIKELEERQDAL